MGMPKTSMPPASGRISPAMVRRSTVLPEPLPPMITSVSRLSRANETPRSTSVAPKRLRSSVALTMWSDTPLPEQHEQELREKEIRHDHAHGHVDDGGGGGAAETFGAALGAEPVVAADQRDQPPEEHRLGHTGEEV